MLLTLRSAVCVLFCRKKGGHVWKMLTRLKNVAVGSALPAYEVAFGKHRAAFQLGQASGSPSLFKSSGEDEKERERGG